MTAEEIGWVILRAGVAYLFLKAAWACGKDAAARQWTTDETAILFPAKYARLFAYGGIAIMGFGGLSILLGGWPGRVGGGLIAVFVLLGAQIHLRQMARADDMAARLKEVAPVIPEALLTDLTVSAKLGHYSSSLKNYALAAVGAFFALAGTGPALNLFP